MFNTLTLLISLAALPHLISARYLELGTGKRAGDIDRSPVFSIAGVDGGRNGFNFESDGSGKFTLVSTSHSSDKGPYGAGPGKFGFDTVQGHKECHLEALPNAQINGGLLRWAIFPEHMTYQTYKVFPDGHRGRVPCAEREADGYRLVCGGITCTDAP